MSDTAPFFDSITTKKIKVGVTSSASCIASTSAAGSLTFILIKFSLPDIEFSSLFTTGSNAMQASQYSD